MNSKETFRKFYHIAKLIKLSRKGIGGDGLTQKELNNLVGFSDKQGQFMSNIERGLCSIPGDKILKLSSVLNISIEEIVTTIILDYKDNLYRQIEMSKEQKV